MLDGDLMEARRPRLNRLWDRVIPFFMGTRDMNKAFSINICAYDTMFSFTIFRSFVCNQARGAYQGQIENRGTTKGTKAATQMILNTVSNGPGLFDVIETLSGHE
jgi:hypothetical protein